MSIRRSHGGSRRSSSTSRRSGSGPPSMSIRPPRPPSTRIESPWPTSRTVIRVVPSARWAATERERPHDARRPGRARRARRERRRARVDVVAAWRRVAAPGDPPAPARGATSRAGRRRHAADRKIARPRRPATIVHGGSSVTLANGRAAPARMIVHIAVSSAQAGSPASVATIAGPPATATAPPSSATSAAAIAGATSGTISEVDRRRWPPPSSPSLGGAIALARRPGDRGDPCRAAGLGPADRDVHDHPGGAALPFASVTLGPPWTIVAAVAAVGRPVRGGRARPSPTGRAGRDPGGPAPARDPSRAPSVRRRHARRSARDRRPRLVAAGRRSRWRRAHRVDGTTRITVLDVGQGDSILVEGGRGGRMLIDGGPDPDRLLVELDRRLPPWDRRIDILVLTHPHEDHVAGHAAPPRALPDRPDLRDRDARPGTRLRARSPAISRPRRAAARDPRDRRPDRPRRHPVPRPVAGSGPRAARAARRRPRDQRRLDRPARRGRRPAVPADRRCRGRRRSDARRARPARRSTS